LNRKQKHRLKCYRLVPADFLSLFISQGHTCAICQQSFRSMPKRHLCIDHNHTTGAVRGLLCQGMQSSYRSRKKSIQTLQGAIAYLQQHGDPMDTSPPNNEAPATGKSRVSSKTSLNNDAGIVAEVPQERKQKTAVFEPNTNKFWGKITEDRWVPYTKGNLIGSFGMREGQKGKPLKPWRALRRNAESSMLVLWQGEKLGCITTAASRFS
jgi:hypothetical protein